MKVFERFRLDTVNHCLFRDEERLSLSPKAFDLLRYLVDHAGRVVPQEEILDALWPETYVNHEGIRKYILEIRKTLGDRPHAALFIQTVPKRGYRFIAKVTEESTLLRAAAASAENVVGRETAIRELSRHFADAQGGRREVVFVTGEPGIGKTTVVDLFGQQLANEAGVRIARGQCIEGFGGKESYYPALEAVGSLVRDSGHPAFLQILATRAPTWLVQFPTLVTAENRDSLQSEILGSTRERMIREFCEALEAMAGHTSLVLILEDLHWADRSTLDLISAFARRREPGKLLLVGTYRPEDVVASGSPLKGLKQDLLVHSLCREVAVEPLTERDVAEYLAREFPERTFPSDATARIHRNSGGNPLFMTAIARDLVKRHCAKQQNEAGPGATALADADPGVPDTLHHLLEIQLERLRPEDARLLERCSVAGDRFSAWAGAVLCGEEQETVEERCRALAERMQFIRCAGVHTAANGSESAHYEFRHSLYRHALYRRLSLGGRSKLHRAMGEALMPLCDEGKKELAAELAAHLEEARDYERATRYWITVAENGRSRFAHGDAIEILQHAAELAGSLNDSSETQAQIHTRIGDNYYALGEMSKSAASYELAEKTAAGAGLNRARAAAMLGLAAPAWYLDSEWGNDVCRRALAFSNTLEDPALASRMQLAAASIRLLYDEWTQEDLDICARAYEYLARDAGAGPTDNVLYTYVLALSGRLEDARRHADALAGSAVRILPAKGFVAFSLGSLGEAQRLMRNLRALIDKNGDAPWIWIHGDAWLRLIVFDFDGAWRTGSMRTRTDAEPHAACTRCVSRLAAGYAELYKGNPDAALLWFSQVRDPVITPKFFLSWLWRLQAQRGIVEARLTAGDLKTASQEADELLRAALAVADPNTKALAWEIAARVAVARRDFERAKEFVQAALAISSTHDALWAAWQVHGAASAVYRACGDLLRAEFHATRARSLVMNVANSFEPGDPLRESLLGAPPVRNILRQAASA